MKQFFKFVLASIVGVILSSIILFFLFFILLSGLIVAAGSDKGVDVAANSVLHIQLNSAVSERTPNNPLAKLPFLGLDDDKSIGLMISLPA